MEGAQMISYEGNATIYRTGHVCPFGLKSLDLLKREGFSIDDHWLETPQGDRFSQSRTRRQDNASNLHQWGARRRL